MRVALITILMTTLFVPAVLYAADPLVPCGGEGQEPCNACHLVQLANNIIQFFVILAIAIATLMFTWAGIKYVTSGTKPDQISEAHKIFFNVLIGLIVVLGAWLIIDVILRIIPGTGADFTGIAPWAEVLCK